MVATESLEKFLLREEISVIYVSGDLVIGDVVNV
jgi:hypothetical protein